MRIYKTSDRIPVYIDDVCFIVSPLSFQQKSEITSMIQKAKGDPVAIQQAMMETLRLAIKDVQGFKNEDGSDWRPDFEGGKLSVESVNTIMNVELASPAISYISSFLNAVPSQLPDGVSLQKKTQTPPQN